MNYGGELFRTTTDFLHVSDSVRIGPLWYGPREAAAALTRYCRHVFTHNESDEYPHSFPGSSSLIRINNRYFQFCCAHQVADFKIGQYGFRPESARDKLITPEYIHSVPKVESTSQTDLIDILALEYDLSKFDVPNLETEFFKYEDDFQNKDLPTINFDRLIAEGIPFEYTQVDYDDSSLKAAFVQLDGIYGGTTSSPHLHRIDLLNDLDFSADGLSGGPVFSLKRESRGTHVNFAGMIMRGGDKGSRSLYFIDAVALARVAIGR